MMNYLNAIETCRVIETSVFCLSFDIIRRKELFQNELKFFVEIFYKFIYMFCVSMAN